MKIRVLLLGIVILLAVSTVELFAGGGKVRGENGHGEVHQVQLKDPPPFQEN